MMNLIENCQHACMGGINLKKIPPISVGARVADGSLGGPLWSPASPGIIYDMVDERHRESRRAKKSPRLPAIKALPSHLNHPRPYRLLGLLLLMVMLTIIFTSCSSGNQHAKAPDPRLKSFHILSARIIMMDSQAEVDGSIENLGHDAFPYDVTIVATFYDSSGHVIGQAQGTAEDVFPGTERSFALTGQVESVRYSHMKLAPVSLREVRYEQYLPTPTPVVP